MEWMGGWSPKEGAYVSGGMGRSDAERIQTNGHVRDSQLGGWAAGQGGAGACVTGEKEQKKGRGGGEEKRKKRREKRNGAWCLDHTGPNL